MTKKINWKIRLKNKAFWMTVIPAVLLSVQRILLIAGVEFDLTHTQDLVMSATNSIFVVLAMIGVIADPTVGGFGDSQRALVAVAPFDPKEAVETVTEMAQVDTETAEEIVEEILNS